LSQLLLRSLETHNLPSLLTGLSRETLTPNGANKQMCFFFSYLRLEKPR
jgi:hypothetical protein